MQIRSVFRKSLDGVAEGMPIVKNRSQSCCFVLIGRDDADGFDLYELA